MSNLLLLCGSLIHNRRSHGGKIGHAIKSLALAGVDVQSRHFQQAIHFRTELLLLCGSCCFRFGDGIADHLPNGIGSQCPVSRRSVTADGSLLTFARCRWLWCQCSRIVDQPALCLIVVVLGWHTRCNE